MRLRDHLSAPLLGGVILSWLASVSLPAQDGVITGVVLDARTRQPLAAVRVGVAGAPAGSVTDGSGRFRLGGLAGTTVELITTAVGYLPGRATAVVGSSEVRLELHQAILALDEIIVTGTAGEVERRAIGNSVARLDVERDLSLSSARDVSSFLSGRVPGVLVIPGSGQVGAGPTIQIRGPRSLSLNTNPLVYIDGVRVHHEIGGGNPRIQAGSGVINRLNDINPEDIERIEIIRGPSAATLYGTEASNGVIQVLTRRGTRGKAEFSLTVRQGASWFMNPEERIAPNWSFDSATKDTVSRDIFASESALGNQIFTTGHVAGYSLGVDGGTETLRYFASADVDRDQGIEPTNYRHRRGLRGNLQVSPGKSLDVKASLGWSRAHTQLACEGPCIFGVWYSLITNDPTSGAVTSARRGFRRAPPEAIWKLYDTYQEVDHGQLGLEIVHRPTSSFSQRLLIGEDRVLERNQELFRRIEVDSPDTFYVGMASGRATVNRRDVTTVTADYSASLLLPLRRSVNLDSRTTLGGQYYRRLMHLVLAQGDGFAEPGLETVASAASTWGSETIVENNTLGFFVQQQFSFHDRLYFTGALRVDDNSAFGSQFDLVTYPKISATWVINEEPWWPVAWVDALRLRMAFGAAGQQPQDFGAVRSYLPVTSGNGSPAITPEVAGNPNLGPERGEEWEFGFEAALLSNRLGIDLNVYTARTHDAILLRSLPPSLGFPGNQFVNAGEISNRGIDVLVRGLVYQSSDLSVDLSLNLASNHNEVVDLGGIDQGAGFIPLPGATTRQWHVPGFPAGSWFTPMVVSAEIDSAGKAVNVLCDGGTGPRLPAGQPTRPGGSPVSCDDAPALYAGHPFPSLEGAFQAQITAFGRLRLHALIDFKNGHRKLDNTMGFLRCRSFRLCRENFFPNEYDPRFIAELQDSSNHNWIIRDGSFARLREVSASYTLPERWIRSIGGQRATITVAGRNLHTWTRYGWLDPEAEYVQGPGEVVGERVAYNRQEAGHVPQLAQFITTVSIVF